MTEYPRPRRAELRGELRGRGEAVAATDEGILSFCLPIIILYGDSPLKEQVLVSNSSAPSYTQACEAAAKLMAMVRKSKGLRGQQSG